MLDAQFVQSKTVFNETSYRDDSASVLHNMRDKTLPRTTMFSPKEPGSPVAAIFYSDVIFFLTLPWHQLFNEP